MKLFQVLILPRLVTVRERSGSYNASSEAWANASVGPKRTCGAGGDALSDGFLLPG